MHRLLLSLGAGSLLASVACTGGDPAPGFRIKDLTAERVADGTVATRVVLENKAGPQQTVLCVRVEWLAVASTSRLVDAREACTPNRIDGGGATEVRIVSKSRRREPGDKLVVTTKYGGDYVYDEDASRTVEVPQ